MTISLAYHAQCIHLPAQAASRAGPVLTFSDSYSSGSIIPVRLLLDRDDVRTQYALQYKNINPCLLARCMFIPSPVATSIIPTRRYCSFHVNVYIRMLCCPLIVPRKHYKVLMVVVLSGCSHKCNNLGMCGACKWAHVGRSGPAASRAAAVSLACIFFVRRTQMICVAGLSLFMIIMLPIS